MPDAQSLVAPNRDVKDAATRTARLFEDRVEALAEELLALARRERTASFLLSEGNPVGELHVPQVDESIAAA